MTVTQADDRVAADVAPALRVFMLLRDGRLFGPFRSRDEALNWCLAHGLDGHSTYDALNPWSEVVDG